MNKINFVPFQRQHLKKLKQMYDDPKMTKSLTLTPPTPQKIVDNIYKKFTKAAIGWWAIVYNDEMVGAMHLSSCATEYSKTKMGHVGSFGIIVESQNWGKGIGKKAMRFLIDTARKQNIKRLELEVFSGNSRGIALYEGLGFKIEGVQKKRIKNKNGYEDTIMMAKWLR